MNLFDYVLKYGDISFSDKEFNEVDNIVFSLISYLDFTHTEVNEGRFTLEEIGKSYLDIFSYNEIKKIGEAQRDAYKLLEILIKKERYKHTYVSNYIYEISKESQFSACTFKLKKDLTYICFEGTDEVVSGWKEDGEMSAIFPVPAQEKAINYVNKNVKLFGGKYIIGGHSKGGNLALVSGIFINRLKRFKIIKIYSNDGPGLRKEEYKLKKYEKIKDRFIHIVPEYSVIGMLLKNDNNYPIKSTKTSIFCHSISTWIVEDDHLVKGEISIRSKKLEEAVSTWLDTHTDEEKLKMVRGLFKVFEDAEITHLTTAMQIKNVIKILKGVKKIDKEVASLIVNLFSYSFKHIRQKEKV